MSTEELIERRHNDYKKTTNHQEPSYVPIQAIPGPGVLEYAGTNLKDAFKDNELFTEKICKIFEVLYADTYISPVPWIVPSAKDLLGDVQFYIGPDGFTVEHVQKSLMNEDEYPHLIKDVDEFIANTLIPRKYPQLFEDDMKKVTSPLKIIIESSNNTAVKLTGMVNDRMLNKFGLIPCGDDFLFLSNPLDIIFDTFRGFVGTTKDIRRHTSLLKEACDMLWEKRSDQFLNVDYDYPYAQQAPHIPTYLNPKQFEELYWPYEKMMIENLAKNGNKAHICLEGRWKHLLEYFKDVPKDSCILFVDDDDVFEVADIIGDYHTICGGIPMTKINYHSKEKSFDYIRRLFDKLAPGGGFIFSTNKFWISPCDVTQNLIDVYNFAHEYGKY